MIQFGDGIGTVNLGVVCLCICTCSHFGVAAVVWMLTVSLKSPCERKAHLQDDAIGTLWKPRRECLVGLEAPEGMPLKEYATRVPSFSLLLPDPWLHMLPEDQATVPPWTGSSKTVSPN